MEILNRTNAGVPAPYPERVLQFGGGNFLRAFAGWILDVFNEKTGAKLGVTVVTAVASDHYEPWQRQDGLYHILTKGIRNGQIVDESYLVKSIGRILHLHPHWAGFLQTAENPDLRYVISNTTEAGIRFSTEDALADAPPREFPARLTRWLYHRYQHFNGSTEAGCIFLPVELIGKNGETLRHCILRYAGHWELEAGFAQWIRQANIFCNTLVDRIVPGVALEALPQEWQKLGFQDDMLTQGDAFHFWAIEAPQTVRDELPLDKIGLNVLFTYDLTPYRNRKVRILNGAHTAMVPVSYLYGLETVRETVEHEAMGKWVEQVIFEEIIPTLDLPGDELIKFANDVIDRFKNPFIRHQLLSIALNSISKFRTRMLPSLLEYYQRKGALPRGLVLSLAALIHFYKGDFEGKTIPLNDDQWAMDFFERHWHACDGSDAGLTTLARQVLQWEQAWETDLSSLPGLHELLSYFLIQIKKEGIHASVKNVLT